MSLHRIILISIAILMIAGVAEAQLMDSAWAKFHRNIENTGQSSYPSSSDGTLKWNYTTGGLVDSSPAIASDGTIYVGSYDGKLHAINQDGTLKWNYTIGTSILSSPAIASDGTIYIGSDNYKLYAINSDGTLKWNYTMGYGIYSSPAIASDGTIYVGNDDGKLYAVNSNGTLKWNYTAGSWFFSSPAIAADGTIYIGSNNWKLYAINSDGTLKWNYTTGSNIDSSPAIASDGTIYVGSDDGKLYAIYPNGTLKWSYYTTAHRIYSSPAIASDGTIYVGSRNSDLYAINSDGTLKWNYTTGNQIFSSPAIDSTGTIYVGSDDGKLYAVNPDGTLKWSYNTSYAVGSSPAIASDGTIYVGSADGKLYAFQSSETYRFSGYVRDPDINPIQDATVTLWNVSYSVVAVTNPSGLWNLSGQLSNGYYDILIQKSGYADAQGYLQFTSGGVLLNTTLYNVNINGTVYDASNGSVLSSVNISLYQNNHYANGTGRYFNTTSDANGTYTLNGFLANKRIDVNATKPAYTHNDFNVTPLQAGNYIMDLYLVPVCPGGNVCGLVLSWPWYQAIPGATVNIWNATYSNTTTTNDWGYYVYT